MPHFTDLWKLTLQGSPELVDALQPALEDRAVSLATLHLPNTTQRKLEALFTAQPDLKSLTLELSVLAALKGLQAPKLKLEEMPRLNWVQKVADEHPPMKIGRWIIHSAAYRQTTRHARNRVQIDVTNAFGTGEHPTTGGCLLMLDDLLRNTKSSSQWRMLDVGCGTAILSMAFARATHGKALAVDVDPAVAVTAKEAVHVNGLQAFIHTDQSRGLTAGRVKRAAPYDLIMANIFLEPLRRMAKDVKASLKSGGYAIISGILQHQANAVLSAYRGQGLRLVKRLDRAGWAIFLLQR